MGGNKTKMGREPNQTVPSRHDSDRIAEKKLTMIPVKNDDDDNCHHEDENVSKQPLLSTSSPSLKKTPKADKDHGDNNPQSPAMPSASATKIEDPSLLEDEQQGVDEDVAVDLLKIDMDDFEAFLDRELEALQHPQQGSGSTQAVVDPLLLLEHNLQDDAHSQKETDQTSKPVSTESIRNQIQQRRQQQAQRRLTNRVSTFARKSTVALARELSFIMRSRSWVVSESEEEDDDEHDDDESVHNAMSLCSSSDQDEDEHIDELQHMLAAADDSYSLHSLSDLDISITNSDSNDSNDDEDQENENLEELQQMLAAVGDRNHRLSYFHISDSDDNDDNDDQDEDHEVDQDDENIDELQRMLSAVNDHRHSILSDMDIGSFRHDEDPEDDNNADIAESQRQHYPTKNDPTGKEVLVTTTTTTRTNNTRDMSFARRRSSAMVLLNNNKPFVVKSSLSDTEGNKEDATEGNSNEPTATTVTALPDGTTKKKHAKSAKTTRTPIVHDTAASLSLPSSNSASSSAVLAVATTTVVSVINNQAVLVDNVLGPLRSFLLQGTKSIYRYHAKWILPSMACLMAGVVSTMAGSLQEQQSISDDFFGYLC